MKSILKWATFTALIVTVLDLLPGLAAILGLVHSGVYQIANMPALMFFPSGPDSVIYSLPIWIPQMAAIAFGCGAIGGALQVLTNRFIRLRVKHAPAER